MFTKRLGIGLAAALLIGVGGILLLSSRPTNPDVAGASSSPVATPGAATPLASASASPTEIATATPAPTTVPEPIPTLMPLSYTQSHTSKLYHYTTRFPKAWSLTAGTEPNSADTVPDLGTGRSDFYEDGVASGVMITSAPVSQARSDLATWSAFVTTTVEHQYGSYIGIQSCTEPSRSLVVDRERANEVDFICPGRSWLWVTTVHAGQAYQIAWLDDNGFGADYLRPFLDQFLATFAFTK